MKRSSYLETETIPRDYGTMVMLAGGSNVRTSNVDMRILRVRAKSSTSKHYHRRSESIFHILQGEFVMEVGDARERLVAGDTIVIEVDEIHVLRNVGEEEGIVVESMSPPFSKTDIFYLDDAEAPGI